MHVNAKYCLAYLSLTLWRTSGAVLLTCSMNPQCAECIISVPACYLQQPAVLFAVWKVASPTKYFYEFLRVMRALHEQGFDLMQVCVMLISKLSHMYPSAFIYLFICTEYKDTVAETCFLAFPETILLRHSTLLL